MCVCVCARARARAFVGRSLAFKRLAFMARHLRPRHYGHRYMPGRTHKQQTASTASVARVVRTGGWSHSMRHTWTMSTSRTQRARSQTGLPSSITTAMVMAREIKKRIHTQPGNTPANSASKHPCQAEARCAHASSCSIMRHHSPSCAWYPSLLPHQPAAPSVAMSIST